MAQKVMLSAGFQVAWERKNQCQLTRNWQCLRTNTLPRAKSARRRGRWSRKIETSVFKIICFFPFCAKILVLQTEIALHIWKFNPLIADLTPKILSANWKTFVDHSCGSKWRRRTCFPRHFKSNGGAIISVDWLAISSACVLTLPALVETRHTKQSQRKL